MAVAYSTHSNTPQGRAHPGRYLDEGEGLRTTSSPRNRVSACQNLTGRHCCTPTRPLANLLLRGAKHGVNYRAMYKQPPTCLTPTHTWVFISQQGQHRWPPPMYERCFDSLPKDGFRCESGWGLAAEPWARSHLCGWLGTLTQGGQPTRTATPV